MLLYLSDLSASRFAQCGSGCAALRIPIAFEVRNQCRAEMAIGLLAGIYRKIRTERLERLLGNAQGAAVSCCAYYSRIGQPGHDALDRAVHLTRGDNLV